MSTLLAGALLAGCSSAAPASDAGKGGKDLVVQLFISSMILYEWCTQCYISKAAEGKAQLEIVDSQNSQPAQNDKVDLFINKEAKALAINPVDRNAAGVIVDKAKKANIPVVFLNREPFPLAKMEEVGFSFATETPTKNSTAPWGRCKEA